MSMKPIETNYKGYRFRSRLEARWAVFFDALGVPWEYEPEGFETSAGWYLPDFKITPRFQHEWAFQSHLYVEVKAGPRTTEEDWAKPKALVHWDGSTTGGVGVPVLLLAGPPRLEQRRGTCAPRSDTLMLDSTCFHNLVCAGETYGETVGGKKHHFTFSHFTDEGSLAAQGYWQIVSFAVDDVQVQANGRYAQAVRAALSARFEHGEAPL
jgi:hypothetical protein